MSITHDRGKTAILAIDEDADRIPEGVMTFRIIEEPDRVSAVDEDDIESTADLKSARTLGHNAARIVVGIPLRTDLSS
jgi:hypothetical protein